MVFLKKFLGPILIEENPSASLARSIIGQDQREDLRFLERTLHKVSPTLGEGMGKLNNTIDSIENVAESIDPLTRLDNVFVGMSVDEALRSLRRGDHIKVQRLPIRITASMTEKAGSMNIMISSYVMFCWKIFPMEQKF